MKKDNSGFTLIELICVIAILGLVTVSIFSFILSGMGMAKETKKSMALSGNARTAINKMKTDIMNCGGGVVGSDSIEVSSDGKLILDSTVYNGAAKDLGNTFYLMTRDGTASDGVNATYTINCYRYDSTDEKIYYGRAKNVAITSNLNSNILTTCSPTHVLCDHVSSFTASVFPEGETVTETKSDGSTESKLQIKAKRVHVILSLDRDNKNFHTQQDAAVRSDVRYFKNFSDAAVSLNS